MISGVVGFPWPCSTRPVLLVAESAAAVAELLAGHPDRDGADTNGRERVYSPAPWARDRCRGDILTGPLTGQWAAPPPS
ncbi:MULTISPECIES: hypothetical protein [Streptomyces]|uniref:Uncharacterized protein n=1 Tax=Streptomyces venezuelae TaxID=54571 RepID=A0A5P2B4L5_STRVZ|nr:MULTISPECIES: hypothetical protein [Streptomyces]NEA05387.1 hypothetical protein [Streptomyces sp. SID10116]MYY83448.1 hypothetical protein [Streptomyces sp. SID335]MYZ14554.1 hypothetical protein [Streptomyces sp. SID337]NDZ91221.1 hypothetical protein [Streptomyces sp. SID10115]NEB46106.1 hypothetical protein [Streptomyces sp. SID339]